MARLSDEIGERLQEPGPAVGRQSQKGGLTAEDFDVARTVDGLL